MNLRDLIPPKYQFVLVNLKGNLLGTFRQSHYSQSGEDIIVRKIFNKKRGFYVDVGAYHPKHYSNTYLFYKDGWKGINIDPNKDAIKLFNIYRPKDINIQCGISQTQQELPYFRFSHPSCNTFSQENAQELMQKKWIEFLGKESIQCFPLGEILHKHVPVDITIDLLTIDTEGFDLQVLESNDWNTYVPKAIIIESTIFDPATPETNEIYSFLIAQGYSLHAFTGMSLIFKHV